MQHLANLRHLTSLSIADCHYIKELRLENFERLSSLAITGCRNLTESVVDTSRGALRQLTTLKLSCKFTETDASHLKALTTLTHLDLEGNLYGTPMMMEAIGELSGLISLRTSDDVECESEEGVSHLTKLKCLRSLSATMLDANDLETICNGIPTLTSLEIPGSKGGLHHLLKLKNVVERTSCYLTKPAAHRHP